eukprot:CAMPEP_0117455458 /NCGR_PEP_ID=MMETSP0759-20121206/11372_1 /TAXON_ID=63605 /ORGANISM="Percolomonas cosmopolitus, Strain WS" /LENGTH=480 /DNA_ID=CAMNT_0005248767 /DNA_START=591 /DNA_END=2033 /DNA_ORIENTATION=-
MSTPLPSSHHQSHHSTDFATMDNTSSLSAIGGNQLKRSSSLNSLSSTLSSSPDPCKEDLPVMKLTDTFREMKHKMQKQEVQYQTLQDRKEALFGKMKRMDEKVRDLLQRKEELEMELKRIERKQSHVRDELQVSHTRFSDMTERSRKLEREIEMMWNNGEVNEVYGGGAGSSSSCYTFEGHQTGVLCVALASKSMAAATQQQSSQMQMMASGARDGMIRLWNISTSGSNLCGGCDSILRGHRGWVKTVAFDAHSPRFLLSGGGGDHQVRLWDTSTSSCVSIFKGHQAGITCLQSDEASIVSASLDKTLRCWDKVTGRCVARFRGHQKFVKTVRFDHHAMISAGGDDHIRLWDMRAGKCVRVFHHAGGSNTLCYTDESIISGGRNGTICTFDLTNGGVVNTLKACSSVLNMELNNSVLTYCTASVPAIFQHDILTNTNIGEFIGHSKPVTDVAVGDNFVVSSSWDGTVKMFSCLTGNTHTT